MKKISLLAILLIATSTLVLAQPRAIGGRLGWDLGASYQHQIGEKNMIQADLDFLGWGLWGTQATVTFNWLIPLVSVNAGELNLYPGVGIGGGYEWFERKYWVWYTEYPYAGWAGSAFVGVAGMIGIEWRFKFPLELSFEYRPLIGPEFYSTKRYGYTNGISTCFYWNGLWASAVAVGVRYKFGGK
ncbi:MAG: hypothetical protein FWF70_07895 [Bacteroidetes bacterium]|nr:hypothetical protein [Bacteroidota bacterium]MCL1968821.1 hypothetical protein [Bacteroidota bacterium]